MPRLPPSLPVLPRNGVPATVLAQDLARSPASLVIDSLAYLDIPAASRIKPRLDLVIADRAYRPDPDDPQRDWVASVAAPAFKQLRARRGAGACRAFLSVGTGAGVDALAGIELLEADTVGITDLFEDVVATAAGNIRRNVAAPVLLHAAAGDLLQPLRGSGVRFDVIYENLPNLPLADAGRLQVDRTSAAFVPPRTEAVPEFVADWLLVLHYLALKQARDFLAPGGTVLSTLGTRLPLGIIADMTQAAGYKPSFLTYGWKLQADAADVIAGYAHWQRSGFGPFHFYPADRLEAAFVGLDPGEAGAYAYAIERSLAPARLDAVAALEAWQAGTRIGHTFVVLKSDPR
jgi:methylase of polypeptide subunit release factors